MQTLYFLRFESASLGPIVFLQTAKSAEAAEAAGRAGINPAYAASFRLAVCESVCKTRDAVDLFEPC